jgi:hypothetical protein
MKYLSFPFAIVIALAAATPYSPPPTIEKSPNFRITANPGSPDHPLSYIQGYNLSFYQYHECYQEAVFYLNESPDIFYVNGTDEEFADRRATLQTDHGGPSPWPHGVGVSEDPDEEGRTPIFMGCGSGSPGLQVAEWPGRCISRRGRCMPVIRRSLTSPLWRCFGMRRGSLHQRNVWDLSFRLGVWMLSGAYNTSLEGTRRVIGRDLYGCIDDSFKSFIFPRRCQFRLVS